MSSESPPSYETTAASIRPCPRESSGARIVLEMQENSYSEFHFTFGHCLESPEQFQFDSESDDWGEETFTSPLGFSDYTLNSSSQGSISLANNLDQRIQVNAGSILSFQTFSQMNHNIEHRVQLVTQTQTGEFLDYYFHYLKVYFSAGPSIELSESRVVFYFITGLVEENLKSFLFHEEPKCMLDVLKCYFQYTMRVETRTKVELYAQRLQETNRILAHQRMGYPVSFTDDECAEDIFQQFHIR